ncbi:neuronal acetylcholine receptor subunit alpha-10 isoform X2 [Octopus sinensis]|uniref:Neuronal acetylcholine receptor subunit alpha-10 isoform X2 n=1 Tax=Octopus sinensis TaxID=2607531 RepID=A0A6P7S5A9_9MOLL|nr:neuronal acetylcholine receptor subunit alpha-10 isoform X2 [Octopus sinensis]XP_036356854.1 neuronal acetylcholine receptor subunit alpha-10 isoform X2 [Octopus sinensis]XP_036356855.1 neuronal acetylcholine receptor subunit alpha-10 isoform X2 [Octopus sinensis]
MKIQFWIIPFGLYSFTVCFGERNRYGRRHRRHHVEHRRTPDEQRLLSRLLANYDTASRPVYNASHAVVVKFGFTLTQIADMDEVNQVLTTNVWIEQEWNDERLRWKPEDYNGLEKVRIPCEKIWLPDIVLYNSADDFTTGYMQSKAMVSSDGTVFWPPPAKLRSSCKIDITYFPFDDQMCKMKFGSWIYDGFQVDVTNRSADVDLTNYVYSGEWDLLNIKVIRNEVRYTCCKEHYPDVTFTIVIRRRTLYYLFNIIFPCLWLTILSLLGFWLPPDSGEKITLGITVLLAFSVFMLLIAENMPATSEFVPLIGIYLTVTMGMTSLSIILTVFVLQLHHVGPQQKPVARWLKLLSFNFLARLVCISTHGRREPWRRYALTDDIPKEDMCLTTYVDSTCPSDPANCNGTLAPSNALTTDKSGGSTSHGHGGERITRHLKILVSRQEADDHEEVVLEWQLVALVMDRFLFWIFLIGSFLSSLVILVIEPLRKPDVNLNANS